MPILWSMFNLYHLADTSELKVINDKSRPCHEKMATTYKGIPRYEIELDESLCFVVNANL
jgi:hypothetical protein